VSTKSLIIQSLILLHQFFVRFLRNEVSFFSGFVFFENKWNDLPWQRFRQITGDARLFRGKIEGQRPAFGRFVALLEHAVYFPEPLPGSEVMS